MKGINANELHRKSGAWGTHLSSLVKRTCRLPWGIGLWLKEPLKEQLDETG
jgi:hypothetical protein